MAGIPGRRRIDWPPVRAEYVEGIAGPDGTRWPSYDELAARWGIAAAHLHKRAGAERWPAQRAQFRERVELERRELHASEVARLSADIDLSALRIARTGLNTVALRVHELGQAANRRAEQLRDHQPVTVPATDAQEMDRLSRAAGQWYALADRALGDTTPLPPMGDITDDDDDLAARDDRALGVLAILMDHDLLPPQVGDVIDVTSHVLGAAGNGAGPHRNGADPPDE